MKKEEALRLLKSQLHQVEWLKAKRSSKDFAKWRRDTEIVVEKIFGTTTRHMQEFKNIHFTPVSVTLQTTDADYQRAYVGGLSTASAVLSSMIKEVSDFWDGHEGGMSGSVDVRRVLSKICSRFHVAAKALQSRRHGKVPFTIDDEYDVQDLIHAFLKMDFDDIRPEEWSPSYAGGSSRMDFLLKDEKVVIEIKKTRKGLTESELGAELIVDIEKYRVHPDCRSLLCFVYDPDGYISNPRGLEKDLTNDTSTPDVKVLVRPN